MLRAITPRSKRSKRALEARAPKEVEDARTALFVRGMRPGEVVNGAMKDLMALKTPHAIAFSKKNDVRPFEDTSALASWAQKTDASMVVVGTSTKKRPSGMVIARLFDGRVLDMCEVGVTGFVGMTAFKAASATPGYKPMMHFAGQVFDTHPRYVQLKSLLMALFNGEEVESICLAGLEHVISVTAGPSSGEDVLPGVHVRTYMVERTASGTRVPRVGLTEMGPRLDLTLRRSQEADPDMWKAAMKRPKMRKQEVEQGLGKRKKNVEVDEMGDVRGRVHVGKQDLEKLQTRKMKSLKHGDDSEPRLKRSRIM